MLGNQYLTPASLPTRGTGTRIVQVSQDISATDPVNVTIEAIREDIVVGLPTPVGYAGLYFQFHKHGHHEVLFYWTGFSFELDEDMTDCTLESDGLSWQVVEPLGFTSAPRMWDGATSRFRLATSLQDIVDLQRALIESIVKTLQEEGIKLQPELEDFVASLPQ